MKQHRPEVADVIRDYGAAYRRRYRPSKEQYRVLNALAACRTAALGGHLKRCERCHHEVVVYNSCRNRHCPKCQGAARAAWLEAREQEVLDVEYFHVVFTLPHELAPLALQNRRAVYSMFFRAASETLLTLGRDPKYLGAEIGCVVLLHTWGQNLHVHPHLHVVVPGGGLSPDGKRWVSCRDGFFLPERVLSRLFRGKFLAELQRAWEHRQLGFHGRLHDLEHPKAWEAWLEPIRNKDWVVHAEPPFGGPEQVLKYLARYTHRVAISNQRLISFEDGKVSFQWKDYAQGGCHRTMTLDAVEFLRRFLLHVLPRGFVHIRYYRFLANRNRRQKLQHIRSLLGPDEASIQNHPSDDSADNTTSNTLDDVPDELTLCPQCKSGRLLFVEKIPNHLNFARLSWSFDSS
jgi:hypothetical protein